MYIVHCTSTSKFSSKNVHYNQFLLYDYSDVDSIYSENDANENVWYNSVYSVNKHAEVKSNDDDSA